MVPRSNLRSPAPANFFGAVMTYSFDSGGTSSAGFHFDESLLKGGGRCASLPGCKLDRRRALNINKNRSNGSAVVQSERAL